MVEKIGTIRNPLTIIAIFAAIAEISGTAVLPFISDGNQSTYVWFLMIFPLLLVVLFFLTLNFNHNVLYAPSDFKNEENFFKSFVNASPTEKADKLREEVREIENETCLDALQSDVTQPTQQNVTRHEASQRSISARYLLAEELVLSKLSKDLGQYVRRDMRFSIPGQAFLFDGVVMTQDKVIAIEIKYFKDTRSIQKRFKEVFQRILHAAEMLPDMARERFSLIIAIATDAPDVAHNHLANQLYSSIGVTPFPVEIRVFNLQELEEEFNLVANSNKADAPA